MAALLCQIQQSLAQLLRSQGKGLIVHLEAMSFNVGIIIKPKFPIHLWNKCHNTYLSHRHFLKKFDLKKLQSCLRLAGCPGGGRGLTTNFLELIDFLLRERQLEVCHHTMTFQPSPTDTQQIVTLLKESRYN